MRVKRIPAIFAYDAPTDTFKGRFLGLSGYVAFSAPTLPGLRTDAAVRLNIFLRDCARRRVSPYGVREGLTTALLHSPGSHAPFVGSPD